MTGCGRNAVCRRCYAFIFSPHLSLNLSSNFFQSIFHSSSTLPLIHQVSSSVIVELKDHAAGMMAAVLVRESLCGATLQLYSTVDSIWLQGIRSKGLFKGKQLFHICQACCRNETREHQVNQSLWLLPINYSHKDLNGSFKSVHSPNSDFSN